MPSGQNDSKFLLLESDGEKSRTPGVRTLFPALRECRWQIDADAELIYPGRFN
jgi:hypothetical protein